jgi:hypothetical protein
MTHDEFLDAQFKTSFTAGMNQRYHQARASHWACWDRTCKISVGVLAVAGACLSVVTISSPAGSLIMVSAIVAAMAAVVAIALNVLPLGEWNSQHAALFQRWSDLREDVDSLLFELDGDNPSVALVSRLRELEGKVHRICGTEPACRKELLAECFREEEQSRHGLIAPGVG